MKIVFVLGSYLPKCSAVGNCMKNLADVLQEEHEVTVICQARSRHEPSREKIAGYDVIRVHTALQDFRAAVEVSAAGFWHDVGLFFARFARAVSIASPGGSLQPGLTRAYRLALESLTFEPDLLVPTCLPFEAVAASACYVERRTGVRLVPYLFDQFADSKTINRLEFFGKLKRRANLRLERTAFERANSVLHITWSEHVASCLPDLAHKFTQVEHPLLIRPSEPAYGVLECRDIVYTGALDPEVRNPAFVLDVLGCALAGGCFGRARFYVPGYEKFRRFFEGAGMGSIELLSPVSSDKVRGVLVGADWLLSIGNSTSSQKVSKIYEYMAYGKPIIHVASRRDDEVAAELSRYPLSCCLYEGDGVEVCAERLRAFLKETRGSTVDFDVVATLFEDELPSAVAGALIAAGRGQ